MDEGDATVYILEPRKTKYTIMLVILRRIPSFQESAMAVDFEEQMCVCLPHSSPFIYKCDCDI